MNKIVTQSPVCGIYKITNLINGMSYVGQSRNIDARLRQHKNNRKDTHNDHLYKAIIKYGNDGFTFDILEHCDTEQLDELEKKYIIQFGSLSPNGYNLESGGWLLKKLSDTTKRKIGDALSHPVNQYTPSGKYIRSFSSAKFAGGSASARSSIQSVCLGKKKTALGFQWRYAECGVDDISPLKSWRREKNAKVSQYTMNGSYVTTYSSRMDASQSAGVGIQNIHCCLSGTSNSAGGFQWRYTDERLGDIESIVGQRAANNTPVSQFAIDGTHIATFSSLRKASEATGALYKSISSCCRGRRNKTKGFIWRYA